MFVRVNGRRIETCPISGTIRRGADPIEDSAQILKLLNSKKDESELTMCSDVDRNDKSRVCEPGSVRVIGRRQIEMYSRLIHTVDHIEGRLREGMDAFDAFHMLFSELIEREAEARAGGAGVVLGDLALRMLRVQTQADVERLALGAGGGDIQQHQFKLGGAEAKIPGAGADHGVDGNGGVARHLLHETIGGGETAQPQRRAELDAIRPGLLGGEQGFQVVDADFKTGHEDSFFGEIRPHI